MRVKWSNIALAALVLAGVVLWRSRPAWPSSPWPAWNGPYRDAYTLAFWGMLLVVLVAVVKLLMRRS